MIDAPCKNCQDRKAHCHGTCTAYRTYRETLDKHHALERKRKKEETDFWESKKKKRKS